MRVPTRKLAPVALLAAAVAALVIVIGGGSSYMLRVRLANASGLRNGSPVQVGGVTVGSVQSLRLGTGDVPVATLALNPGERVSAAASAAIVPNDLLGSMHVQLTPGTGQPLPSGAAVIPSSHVSYPVQLDQVLNVLDAPTRARLAVLVNEAGLAVTGRSLDLNDLLRLLPNDFGQGSVLLGQLAADNHSLADLVLHGDGLITQFARQRTALNGFIRNLDGTLATTAERHAALEQTLRAAPATLTTLRSFLTRLDAAASPLQTAARALSRTAPELTGTLSALPGFERAAQPALSTALQVAPLLSRLGTSAEPVVQKAVPTLAAVNEFVSTLAPASHVLGLSIDNTLGTVEGWARAIQTRDGIGHVFHGLAVAPLETIRSLVSQLAPSTASSRQSHTRRGSTARLPRVHTPGAAVVPPPANRPSKLALPNLGVVGNMLQGVAGVVHGVTSAVLPPHGGNSGTGGSGASPAQLQSLLNYLLGK